MIAEMNEFSVSGEMLWVMGQTGRRQVDCSRGVEVVEESRVLGGNEADTAAVQGILYIT